MAQGIYDEQAYKDFYQQLIPVLHGPNVTTVDMDWLEPRARDFAQRTKYGSYNWSSKFSSRLANKTVYLGSERIRLPNASEEQLKIVARAPEEMKKILHVLQTLPVIHLRRQMSDNEAFNPICDLYVTVADPKNMRLAYMWGNTMFDPSGRPGPNFIMIHIPEEHQSRAQILTFPEYNLNIALGTDYMGEEKKGFLRQAMWASDEAGNLGLHSGSKIVTVRDPNDNRLKQYGVFMFGMTATGKSTWSCHQLGLEPARGEKTEVCQDDIVFLRPDGSAFGSENNFYVKTDVVPDQQEAMYYALTDRTACLENVMISSNGEINFLDESLCGNGRAIVFREKLRVKRDGKLIGISASTINLPSLEEMDGLIFAFITRRNTIMPFAQELTPQQGVLAYLWGESTHSFATNPEKVGESVRIVGTDDFIIGSRARKVNRLYDIIMNLVSKYPNKVRFLMYNTGGMGEIIETAETGGKTIRKVVRKAERVPLQLMASIQRGDLRRSNTYLPGVLGTRSIAAVEGRSLSEWDLSNLYSKEQVDAYLREIIAGRRAFTEEIAREGLRPEIIRDAERAFEIDPSRKRIYALGTPETASGTQAGVVHVRSEGSLTRPKRPGSWRWR